MKLENYLIKETLIEIIMFSYDIEFFVGILIETRSSIQLRMNVSKSYPVSSQIISHDMDSIQ